MYEDGAMCLFTLGSHSPRKAIESRVTRMSGYHVPTNATSRSQPPDAPATQRRAPRIECAVAYTGLGEKPEDQHNHSHSYFNLLDDHAKLGRF